MVWSALFDKDALGTLVIANFSQFYEYIYMSQNNLTSKTLGHRSLILPSEIQAAKFLEI